MSAETLAIYNTVLAVLSLVAIAGSIALLVYRMVKGPEAAELLNPGAIWLAWLVAAVATIGSLIYSGIVGFMPCRLCWYQRIAMYPLSIVLLVGAIRREAVVRWYGLPLALGGLLISIYHYLIELNPGWESGTCDPLNPCSARHVEAFGFISIPFMAGAGFMVIATLLAFYVRDSRE